MHIPMHFITRTNLPPIQTIIAFIPLLASIVSTLVTVILARATLRYVSATDKSLQLAREQFEREWAPELHIHIERVSPAEAKLTITNLAKSSVLMQLVQIRKIHDAVPFAKYPLNHPLVGGRSWAEDVGERFLSLGDREFRGTIAASVTFFCSGRLYRSDWFRFDMEISHGSIHRLIPVTAAANRARVIEAKVAERALRRQAVVDVVAGANGNGEQG
jgi:cell division protein FtsL